MAVKILILWDILRIMQKHRHHSSPKFTEDRILRLKNESAEEIGLLDFLNEKIKDQSRTSVKSWLKHGQVMVGGKITTAFDAPVSPGDEVLVNTARQFITLRHPRLKLVYEDDDVIVVEKGYGLLSVGIPGAGKKKVESAYDILRDYVKRKNPRNKLFVVHRLDRDTSGLMMFVKNEEAMETLRHNWNNYVLERYYVALLEGIVEDDEGIIKSNLAENSQYIVYTTEDPDGKLAVTRYKVLRRSHGKTLVEFALSTGRKNQIRVHASDIGHPICGDRKYGAKSSRAGRLCLHARTLRFAHPVTKKDMNFESPVPREFFK